MNSIIPVWDTFPLLIKVVVNSPELSVDSDIRLKATALVPPVVLVPGSHHVLSRRSAENLLPATGTSSRFGI